MSEFRRLRCWIIYAGLLSAPAIPVTANTLTVTLNTDTASGGQSGSGPGTAGDLRRAILKSTAGDTIVFNCGTPCVIVLSGPLPAITHPLTIDGGSVGHVIIDGNGQQRVFFADTANVTLRYLQFQDRSAQGGRVTQPVQDSLPEIRQQIAMLEARANGIRESLDNIKGAQRALGAGLSSQLQTPANLMNSYMRGAIDALNAGDAASAKGLMDKAEHQVEILEKLLNR